MSTIPFKAILRPFLTNSKNVFIYFLTYTLKDLTETKMIIIEYLILFTIDLRLFQYAAKKSSVHVIHFVCGRTEKGFVSKYVCLN